MNAKKSCTAVLIFIIGKVPGVRANWVLTLSEYGTDHITGQNAVVVASIRVFLIRASCSNHSFQPEPSTTGTTAGQDSTATPNKQKFAGPQADGVSEKKQQLTDNS